MNIEAINKNFEMVEPVITAYGSLGDDGVQINYSSILSKLIKEVGTHCESYSSDLFMDWSSLMTRMSDEHFKSETMLFGIRKHGVDHITFICARLDGKDVTEKDIDEIYCGGIWMLKISVGEAENTLSYKPVIMKLGKTKWISSNSDDNTWIE